MRRRFAALSLLLASVATVTSQSAAPLTGRWEGQMLLNSNWRFMEAEFGAAAEAARVDLPQERRQFADFSVDGRTVRWTLQRGQARIRFEGVVEQDVIRGRAEQAGVTGEFQLVRVTGEKPRHEHYTGTYRTPSGGLVTVARFDFGDDLDRLAMLDGARGYWGTLMRTGGSRFVLAPARSGRFPTNLGVEFSGDVRSPARTITVTGPDRERVVAARVDLYEPSDVTFTNGDVTLAGTVVRARTAGRRPGVVVVHSSGNQSRNGPNGYFRLIANILASQGITTLLYDKRGVGGSTGSWTTASFDDLAGDAAAAVGALRRTRDVHAARVGFLTLSQGGWVAPLAASRDPRIAFLGLISAAATSPAQQEIDRVAAVMRAAGSPDADVTAATDYLRTFFAVVSGARAWDDLEAAMTRTTGADWLSYVPRPRTVRELGWSPSPATLDPALVFSRVRAPVLAVHGADDVDVPAQVNSSMFARLAVADGSRQHVFVGADHYMLEGVRDPDQQHRRLAAGYLDLLVSWIHARPAARE